MLEITSKASQAIRHILDSEGVPEGASFRISAQQSPSPDAASSFAVSITDQAPDEDQVVEGEDVEVRVEPTAAEMLDDKQLDASVADGNVQFSLIDQAA